MSELEPCQMFVDAVDGEINDVAETPVSARHVMGAAHRLYVIATSALRARVEELERRNAELVDALWASSQRFTDVRRGHEAHPALTNEENAAAQKRAQEQA